VLKTKACRFRTIKIGVKRSPGDMPIFQDCPAYANIPTGIVMEMWIAIEINNDTFFNYGSGHS